MKGSRIGYSMGLNYPPDWGEHTASLRPGDKTVLAPNMTFHMILGMWMDNYGFEGSESFRVTEAVFDEIGFLDSDKIRDEVVAIAKELTAGHSAVRSILLECSMLPPYGKDVQQAVNLPVYDYLTMIDYVYSSVVKKRFDDAM